MSGIKIVLKDLKTGLMFQNMDGWTGKLEEAAGFRDTLAALKFCQRSNLADVAIYVAHPDPARSRVAGFHRHRPVLPLPPDPVLGAAAGPN